MPDAHNTNPYRAIGGVFNGDSAPVEPVRRGGKVQRYCGRRCRDRAANATRRAARRSNGVGRRSVDAAAPAADDPGPAGITKGMPLARVLTGTPRRRRAFWRATGSARCSTTSRRCRPPHQPSTFHDPGVPGGAAASTPTARATARSLRLPQAPRPGPPLASAPRPRRPGIEALQPGLCRLVGEETSRGTACSRHGRLETAAPNKLTSLAHTWASTSSLK